MEEDPLATAQDAARRGDHATAVRLARERETRLARAEPGDLEAATDLIWVRLNLARWLAVQRQPDRRAALAMLDAAQEVWESPPIQLSELVHLLGAELMSLRGFVLRQLGYAAESVEASGRAMGLFTELEQTAPGLLSAIGRVPILLNEGAALADLGRTAESLEPLQEALDTLRASDAGHREVEVELLVLRGTSLTLLGRFGEAEALETEAIALARPQTSRPARHLLVAALNNYATTLTRMRRYEEALGVVRQALGVLEEIDGERRRWGLPLTTEAEILLALGRRAEAASAARRAEPILREYAADVPLLVAGSLANVCLLIGAAEDNLAYATEALERFTDLKATFPGRYDFWWQRATDLVQALGPARSGP